MPVVLNVTVTDASGRFVSDLPEEAFEVLHDGHLAPITLFTRGASSPVSVSLLVDTSTSMEEEMEHVRNALRQLVARLRAGDSAEIVDFDQRSNVLQPITDDRRRLISAIQRLRAGGSTSLYNAMYIALHQSVARRRGDSGRRAIVLLTDGDDTSSLTTFDAVLDIARHGHATVYAIGLGLSERGERELAQLTLETGGLLFLPKRANALGDVYTQICVELASQYLIGFLPSDTPPERDGRAIAVEVWRPHLQARTRKVVSR